MLQFIYIDCMQNDSQPINDIEYNNYIMRCGKPFNQVWICNRANGKYSDFYQ